MPIVMTCEIFETNYSILTTICIFNILISKSILHPSSIKKVLNQYLNILALTKSSLHTEVRAYVSSMSISNDLSSQLHLYEKFRKQRRHEHNLKSSFTVHILMRVGLEHALIKRPIFAGRPVFYYEITITTIGNNIRKNKRKPFGRSNRSDIM